MAVGLQSLGLMVRFGQHHVLSRNCTRNVQFESVPGLVTCPLEMLGVSSGVITRGHSQDSTVGSVHRLC